MMSDEMVAELESSLYGRIAELRAQLAERGMELVIKEMRIDSLTAALDDVRNRWKDAEQDWMQLRAQVAERDATILSLRALRAERDELIAQVTKTLGGHSDSDLLSLATTVAIGYELWSDGHDAQVEALRAQITERGMELAIKEMRIESLLAALDDMRNRWKSAEDDWMQLRAQVAERDATIAELRAQVSNRSVTLARYKHAYQAEKEMFEDAETLRQAEMATVAALRAQVATLNERLSRCVCTDDYGNEAP